MKKLSEERLAEIREHSYPGSSIERPSTVVRLLLDHIAALQSGHQRRMELMAKYKFYIRPDTINGGWRVFSVAGYAGVNIRKDTPAEAFDALFIELEKLEEEKTS